ncbi:MAG: 3-isopropylmalate dehydratase [Acidobacteriia bacterium]|nr:3-isopropylmalate dehydratase [Terriglobia bacterium]
MTTQMKVQTSTLVGRVILKLGNDVSTDVIYPGRFMATVLPAETPQYAFADLAEFNTQLKKKTFPPHSILVGGNNFGCGSSREQAASTLKGHELVIVARGFARIFLQNAINLGLRTIVCPELEASEGDDLEVSEGRVVNRTTLKSYPIVSLPKARQAIINAGGLIPFTRKRLLEKVGKN